MATPLIKQVCQLVGQKRKVKVIARREIMRALTKTRKFLLMFKPLLTNGKYIR